MADKKYLKLLDLKLSIPEYMRLLTDQYIEEWKKSLSIRKSELRKAFQWLILCRSLWLIPMTDSKEEEISEFYHDSKLSLVYYRYLDSLKSIEDSFFLAIGGRYLTAGMALRTALESVIKGVFFFSIFDSNRLQTLDKRFSKIYPCKGSMSYLEYFHEILKDKVGSQDSTEFEIVLELKTVDNCNALLNPSSPLSSEDMKSLPFAWILGQLREWGCLGPFSDDKGFRILWEYLYKDLCSYVHAARRNMVYSRSVILKEPYEAFTSANVNQELLDQYLKLLNLTLNIIGSVFFLSAKDVYNLRNAKSRTIKFLSEIEAFKDDLLPIFLTLAKIIN